MYSGWQTPIAVLVPAVLSRRRQRELTRSERNIVSLVEMEAVIAARYMAYQSLFSTSELGISGPERLAAVRKWPASAT